MAKYKVGDILLNGNDTVDTFQITSITNVSGTDYYTFNQIRGGQIITSFQVPVATVDSDPAWHKKGVSPIVWVAVGGGFALLVLAIAVGGRKR